MPRLKAQSQRALHNEVGEHLTETQLAQLLLPSSWLRAVPPQMCWLFKKERGTLGECL